MMKNTPFLRSPPGIPQVLHHADERRGLLEAPLPLGLRLRHGPRVLALVVEAVRAAHHGHKRRLFTSI